MKNHLEARLHELRDEYEAGTQVLSDLQKKQDELRSTLLRISGAIQVLEEVLAAEVAADPGSDASGPRLVAN
ncbi:hypothetical protein [Zoogloea sp. LCSB751]|uniref:hypothetical protein n=1 Tax=Zoogloea sp. LCSB751 TaxID=1965277 RepID=UPI0009A54613|nr:hypothetical protein [Zoogloea sp. LCSB751]